MLDALVDVFRLRQYFDAVLWGRDLVTALGRDAAFVDSVRRALVTLPWERPPRPELHPLPRFRRRAPALEGRRLALAATGGSGALASVIGAWRVFEEVGQLPTLVSVCSGSALFGFPLACGIPADEVAEFVLAMTAEDYVDVDWRGIGRAAMSGGRGFAGVVKGEKLEASYRRLVGDRILAELAIPCYAPIWNVEENRLAYLGPTTFPEVPVARAVRVAVSIPLFLDPVRLDGGYWCDGGIVDIFPVRPLLDIEPGCDLVLAVNGFYPPGFAGESAYGWRERMASILHVAAQVRTCQQIELARTNLDRLRRHCEVRTIEPVPYTEVRGVGFYRQFLDRRDWPDFIRWGYHDTVVALGLGDRRRAKPGKAEDGRFPLGAGVRPAWRTGGGGTVTHLHRRLP